MLGLFWEDCSKYVFRCLLISFRVVPKIPVPRSVFLHGHAINCQANFEQLAMALTVRAEIRKKLPTKIGEVITTATAAKKLPALDKLPEDAKTPEKMLKSLRLLCENNEVNMQLLLRFSKDRHDSLARLGVLFEDGRKVTIEAGEKASMTVKDMLKNMLGSSKRREIILSRLRKTKLVRQNGMRKLLQM